MGKEAAAEWSLKFLSLQEAKCPTLKAGTTQHQIPACNAVIFLSYPMVNIHYILIILKKSPIIMQFRWLKQGTGDSLCY